MTKLSAPLLKDIEEAAKLLGKESHRFAGKRILITGGCGFLGSYFIKFFKHLNENVLKKPCHLVVVDNLITVDQQNTCLKNEHNFYFIKHDVIEPFHWDKPLDFIIHAAGIASPYYYRKYPLETLEVATSGTKNMLKLAHQHSVKSFLFFSSSEIYGDPDPKHVPTPESYRGNVSCGGPRACYDESKRLGETLCRIFYEQHGVPIKIVRPFNIYGPGMQERDYRVLPNFASRIINGHPLNIYGSGKQTRTFCYVTDALNGFLRVLLDGIAGEVYNVGNPEPEVSVIDLAKKLELVLECHLKVSLIEYPDSYPPDEPMRRCPDITKARLQLGYEPTVGIQEGLRRFMEWASAAYVGEKCDSPKTS